MVKLLYTQIAFSISDHIMEDIINRSTVIIKVYTVLSILVHTTPQTQLATSERDEVLSALKT